ncbi:ancient conserved domain protein 4 [Aphelenchoides avenae]|nr:ancient conserved domain protein 4 [Aphelenchus avenae]
MNVLLCSTAVIATLHSGIDASVCYKFVSAKSPFLDAEEACRQQHGHLASVNSGFANAFINDEALRRFGNETDGYFIGANRLADAERWVWTDGSKFAYTHAAAGEPVRQPGLDCVYVAMEDGLWHAGNCFTRRPFVCIVPQSNATECPPVPTCPAFTAPLTTAYLTPTFPSTSKRPSTSTSRPVPTTTTGALCDNGWKRFVSNSGVFCYRIGPYGDLLDAIATCTKWQSTVVSIHSEEENELVRQRVFVDHVGQMWLGLHWTSGFNGKYQWIDGTPYDYTAWAADAVSRGDDTSSSPLLPFVTVYIWQMAVRKWTGHLTVVLMADVARLVFAVADVPTPTDAKHALPFGEVESGGARIITEKKAHLSGIRVEDAEPGGEAFLGYTNDGVSIVHPDTLVRVVLFGWWLDEVVGVGFTPTGSCSNVLRTVSRTDFVVHTGKRIILKHAFYMTNGTYRICVRQKPHVSDSGILFEMPFVLMDDLRASISTELPPKNYYFPFAIQVSMIGVLLVFSGLFSGLNLGLMALTPQELTLISKSGSKREREYAEAILPVRRSGNFLLCSLLIGNVCVNSAISILFDDLTSGYIALIVSSAGIVVFGEIFPQAVCVKKGLAVGARTIWITRAFMMLTSPLSYPISRLLDWLLGDEVASYDRKRVMEMIKMSTRNEAGLAEEMKIAVGAMEISDKTVSDVMTKIDDVFMLPDTTVLNTKTVTEILRMGYTRIPVYSGDRGNIVSLLFVKDLALLDPDDNFTVKTVCGYHEHKLRFVMYDTPLRVMLEEFKKGEYHLAFVQQIVQYIRSDPLFEVLGVVTLEDILEEILQAEIVDETDAITDNVHKHRRKQSHKYDYLHYMTGNEACHISMQMQIVTSQWLATNHRAFHPDFIESPVLDKLVRVNVHKVGC